jgi:outer membrane protein
MLIAAVLPGELAHLQAADVKLGYVYSDQITSSYKGMSEPNALLTKEKTSFRHRADSLHELLVEAKSDFDAQKLLLSEEGKAAKNAEIDELQRRYDGHVREVYGPNGKLEQKTQELMGPVIQKIKEAVEKVAKNDGYTIVFDASESKLAILYAADEANLTREVLDEINREYAPVTPGGTTEKRYAVTPFNESNDETQEANLGEQCRATVYEILRTQPRTQMVTNTDLTAALVNHGLTGRANITDELVYSLGKDIQADYVFSGSVTKTGKKITITMKAADPRLSKSFPAETGTANRPEELRATLGNMATNLLKKIAQQ